MFTSLQRTTCSLLRANKKIISLKIIPPLTNTTTITNTTILTTNTRTSTVDVNVPQRNIHSTSSVFRHGSRHSHINKKWPPAAPRSVKSLCVPDNMPTYIHGFNDIPELHSANEAVRNILSLEFATAKDFRRVVDAVNNDAHESPLAAEIANMTHRIRHLAEILKAGKPGQITDPVKKAGKPNPNTKHFFIWLIHQRKRKLHKYKTEDLRGYEELIARLEIPPLRSVWERSHRYKSRKFKINVPLVQKRHVDDFEDEFVHV